MPEQDIEGIFASMLLSDGRIRSFVDGCNDLDDVRDGLLEVTDEILSEERDKLTSFGNTMLSFFLDNCRIDDIESRMLEIIEGEQYV